MDRSPFSDPPWGVWTDGEDEEAIECRRGEDEDDPWRHLESVESAETQAFVAAQNARSRRVLDRHPWRQRLAETVDRCLTFRRVSCPRLQQDGCYYWLHAGDREARDVIVRSRQVHEHFGRDPSEGGAEPLFDPAWASEQASIYAHSFSPSGKYCCIVLQEAGSDWLSLRTIDASSGKRVEENDPTWSKFTFGVSWISEEAYLYKRAVEVVRAREMGVPDPAFGLFLHRVGSDPELDVNVLPFGSLFTNKPLVCESLPGRPGQHRWLFVDMYKSTNPESEAFLVELKSDEADEVKNSLGSGRKWLSKGFTGLTTCEHEVVIIVTLDYIHADEDIAQDIGSLCDRHLFISTDTCHERGRIVSYSDEAIDAAPVDGLVPMDELVGESSDVIQSAHLAGRSKVLIIVYMRDACSALAFFDAQTGRRLADVTTDVLPESAAISEVSSRPDSDDFYLKVETLISPPYIVVGRVVEGESEMTLARLLAADDEDQKLVCRREFYQSHDGVRVPMFICHAKDLRLEHGLRRSTLLHAYGGYSVSLQPFFDPFFVTFMRELGGVFAMACIRGGGEYGRAWHEAALGARRTVAFDDFVFAARHLQQTLTEPSLTASYGISNGGLLVSACMVRQPDAFGAVISEVGVHDLLRFHRFTLGRLWMGEFGNPDDARDREYLVKLSPLHNVQAGERYPHVLFTTADHDTRVVPSHSLKMLAELQSKAHGRSGRVLGRIYENAGHEAESKSRQQKIDETVDRLIFLLCSLSRSQERGEELKQEERRS